MLKIFPSHFFNNFIFKKYTTQTEIQFKKIFFMKSILIYKYYLHRNSTKTIQCLYLFSTRKKKFYKEIYEYSIDFIGEIERGE